MWHRYDAAAFEPDAEQQLELHGPRLLAAALARRRRGGEEGRGRHGFPVKKEHVAVVVKTVLASHFGGLVNSPPISEPILVVGLGCSLKGNRAFDP